MVLCEDVQHDILLIIITALVILLLTGLEGADGQFATAPIIIPTITA